MSREYVINTFFNDEPGYFIRVNDDSWDEIYDPNFATTFPSAKAAKAWAKKNTTFGGYIRGMSLSRAIEKFEKTVRDGCIVRRTFDLVDSSISRPYNPDTDTVDDIVKFFITNHEKESLIRYEDYETWPDLYVMTDHLHSVYACYDSNGNMYYSIEIYTRPDGKFENFQKEVLSILDYVTFVDDEGRLILPVFDHYLSEYGNSVSVLYDRDNDNWFVSSRYGDDMTFKDMESMFDYLRRERYWG